MKRFLIFFSFVYCLGNVLKAEQPSICGDWINISQYRDFGEVFDNTDNHYTIRYRKTIIRIKLSEGHYTVRTKTILTHNPEDVSYGRDCTVTTANNDSVCWTTTSKNENWYTDLGDQGGTVDTDNFFKAVLINGTLKVSWYSISTLYDVRGKIIKNKSKYVYDDEIYYKDDQDW